MAYPWIKITLLAITAVLFVRTGAHAEIATPRDSRYTLVIEPFANHAGANAMELTHANDDSGRVFVSTQSGQVFVYGPDGSERGAFLDLNDADGSFRFNPEMKYPFRGLMYIAFHPDYAAHDRPGYGLFYTAYQVEVNEESKPDYDSRDFGGLGTTDKSFVLAEWKVDPNNPDRIDPASFRRVLLLNFHTYANNPHALGEISFNPYAEPGDADYGKLYIAVGDGHNGDYSKPHNLGRAQETDNPFAKILRIDPLAKSDQPYTIPSDNPFGNEVFAIGLRDAQWFSFAKDLEGQVVLIACDIGALSAEEINIVRPGGNYGWDRFEAKLDFDSDRKLNGQASPPVVQYGRFFPKQPGAEPTNAGLVAIMGGIVVSDPNDPAFQGQILFGDLPSGTLMHANYHHALTVEKTGKQSTPYVLTMQLGGETGNMADVLGTERGDVRFGVDQNNAVYLVSKRSDTIFKTSLVYTGEPVRADPAVSQSQAFAGTKGLLITVGGTTSLLLLIFVAVFLLGKRKPV